MLKTLSFAVVHFTVAFAVVYAMTGSFALGSAIAVIEPACNIVAFYLHEKAWTAIVTPSAHPRAVAA